jgi:hypothetical protein
MRGQSKIRRIIFSEGAWKGGTMKLAEALAERSDCQNRIEEIKKRVVRSARVQEGEQPAEDTTELLAESERVFARLLELVSAINRTNSKTAFDTKLAISDAIGEVRLHLSPRSPGVINW